MTNPHAGRLHARPFALCLILLAGGLPVAAQPLPAEPVQVAGGRLVVGVDASVTASVGEDRGFFNYTDYEHNALRMLRLAVNAELRAGRRVAFLAETRMENLDTLEAYAWYVRLRPWSGRTFDIQAGRIPPVFGTFARRTYTSESLLVGMPLAYQYLTSLRPDALPAAPEDLVAMSGRGWLVSYPLGNAVPARGLPVVNALRWDTGIQARAASRRAELALALTGGSLSNPRERPGATSPHVAGRTALRPVPGLELGFSLSTGAFLNGPAIDVVQQVDAGQMPRQRVLGVDLEYSAGYWLVRSEVIFSAWNLPIGGIRPAKPLGASAAYVEGRYRVHPRWYVAARGDRLSFSNLDRSVSGAAQQPWDAPVTRLEAGTGWFLERNVVAKIAYQHNWRDSRRERSRGFVTGQLNWWF